MFKIYVGNLDYKVKVEQLRELFSVLAPIEDLVIPTDPKTNKTKGFAIVMIRDPELGQAAVKAMQGKRLMGRALVVNEAVKKKKAAAPPSKEQLLRNGPFGPRMNRFGDPRAGGSRPSRNPRRSGPAMGRAPANPGANPAASPAASPGPSPTSSPALSPASSPIPNPIPSPTAGAPRHDGDSHGSSHAAPRAGGPAAAPAKPVSSPPSIGPASSSTTVNSAHLALPQAVPAKPAAESSSTPRVKAQKLAAPKPPQKPTPGA